MRISDWSSDVCSSDLPRSQGGSDRHAEEGDAIGKAIRQLVESTDPMTGVVGIGGEEYRLPILSIRAHEIVETQVQRSHRSEEHTSELQSLMRISYAVFCLKKKTTIMK